MAKDRGAKRLRSRAAFFDWELTADLSAASYTVRRASLRSLSCLRLLRRDDCVEYFEAIASNRWASGWLRSTLQRICPSRRRAPWNAARESRYPLERISFGGGCRRLRRCVRRLRRDCFWYRADGS